MGIGDRQTRPEERTTPRTRCPDGCFSVRGVVATWVVGDNAAIAVGKCIDEVKVDRLAGSSYTPDGCNAALQQIKEQARWGRQPVLMLKNFVAKASHTQNQGAQQ